MWLFSLSSFWRVNIFLLNYFDSILFTFLFPVCSFFLTSKLQILLFIGNNSVSIIFFPSSTSCFLSYPFDIGFCDKLVLSCWRENYLKAMEARILLWLTLLRLTLNGKMLSFKVLKSFIILNIFSSFIKLLPSSLPKLTFGCWTFILWILFYLLDCY